MSFRVVSSPEADAEIAEAFAWIAREAPEGAGQWLDGLQDAIDSLRRFPRRCAMAPETEAFDVEIRHLLYKSHRILFTIDRSSVLVLHVRHAARLPLQPPD